MMRESSCKAVGTNNGINIISGWRSNSLKRLGMGTGKGGTAFGQLWPNTTRMETGRVSSEVMMMCIWISCRDHQGLRKNHTLAEKAPGMHPAIGTIAISFTHLVSLLDLFVLVFLPYYCIIISGCSVCLSSPPPLYHQGVQFPG